MDYTAQQVHISRLIGDMRSYVRDCETLMDGWHQKSNHKQKCHDIKNITATIQKHAAELESLISAGR